MNYLSIKFSLPFITFAYIIKVKLKLNIKATYNLEILNKKLFNMSEFTLYLWCIILAATKFRFFFISNHPFQFFTVHIREFFLSSSNLLFRICFKSSIILIKLLIRTLSLFNCWRFKVKYYPLIEISIQCPSFILWEKHANLNTPTITSFFHVARRDSLS